MDFRAALGATINKLQAKADSSDSNFDAWDNAEIEYLQDIFERLETQSAQEVFDALCIELPSLEEEVAREETCPTFDWYDDHYYEKIYSGRLCGCKKAIALYQKSL